MGNSISFRVPDIKKIYWVREKANINGTFAYIHLLRPHTVGTIAQFQLMRAKMQLTFDEAEDSKVCPGTVYHSKNFYGHLILTFESFLKRGEYPGWEQIEMQTEADPWEYQW